MVRKLSLILAAAGLALASTAAHATPLPSRQPAAITDASDMTKGETTALAIGLVLLILLGAVLLFDPDEPESP